MYKLDFGLTYSIKNSTNSSFLYNSISSGCWKESLVSIKFLERATSIENKVGMQKIKLTGNFV